MESIYIVNHLFIDYEYPQNGLNEVWGAFSTLEKAREVMNKKLRDAVRGIFDDDEEMEEYLYGMKVSDDCYIDDNESSNTYNEVNIIEVEIDKE